MKGPLWTNCQTSLSLQPRTRGMPRSRIWNSKTCQNGSCWRKANPFSPEIFPYLQSHVYACSSVSSVLLLSGLDLSLSSFLIFFMASPLQIILSRELTKVPRWRAEIHSPFLSHFISFFFTDNFCMCYSSNDWLVKPFSALQKSPIQTNQTTTYINLWRKYIIVFVNSLKR